MGYKLRIAALAFLDSLIVFTAIFISFTILNPGLSIFDNVELIVLSLLLLGSHHLFAAIFNLYKKFWEYASIGELSAIAKAITYSVLFTGIMQAILFQDVYVRALFLAWMMHILLIGGSRFSWRLFRDRFIQNPQNVINTLVVGAGSAGTMVVRQLQNNKGIELKPIAFIDDDPHKQKLQILGIPVAGTMKNIAEVVEKYKIETIVIAIPSLNKKELRSIYEECAKTTAKTQIMPMIEDIIRGNITINSFKEVEVEDLLGREPVKLDTAPIKQKLTDKTILVTGAGGSIGSEICRQVVKYSPKSLLLLGHGENSIYTIDMELRNKKLTGIEIIPLIADVQDRSRIFEIMERYKPDVVYHAAAPKHVPLMEYNPMEAVKNNIFGTKNVAEAADTFGVKNFVLVSTDKAVNPPNVMGATKRFAEMIIQNIDAESDTKFVAVRFGNVLGSRGSVIPLFKKQIAKGGPVTVTDPEMTRYFMTIPEASSLVIQAGALAGGGEVFVLDMGEPVKIVDLAKNLITLSGYTTDEIEIQFTGLRPGEKLFEELLNENEIQEKQVFPKIHIGKACPLSKNELYSIINSFVEMEQREIKETLISIANTKYSVSERMEAVAEV